MEVSEWTYERILEFSQEAQVVYMPKSCPRSGKQK